MKLRTTYQLIMAMQKTTKITVDNAVNKCGFVSASHSKDAAI